MIRFYFVNGNRLSCKIILTRYFELNLNRSLFSQVHLSTSYPKYFGVHFTLLVHPVLIQFYVLFEAPCILCLFYLLRFVHIPNSEVLSKSTKAFLPLSTSIIDNSTIPRVCLPRTVTKVPTWKAPLCCYCLPAPSSLKAQFALIRSTTCSVVVPLSLHSICQKHYEIINQSLVVERDFSEFCLVF